MFVWAAFFFDNKVRTPCQLVFQDGEYEAAAREVGLGCEVEWFPGGWMSRQRCAGRRGGKAEFPCGLMGRGWAEALRCRLVERCDMVYKKCRWGLLHRQISVFYAGGEYDLCFGAAELLEFVDEVVQFHGGAEGYFDEHGVIAGDAVAFDDIRDGLDEGIEVFFLVGFYFQVDECFYMITEKYWVDLGVVACDQPVFFEVFDPGGDSGG